MVMLTIRRGELWWSKGVKKVHGRWGRGRFEALEEKRKILEKNFELEIKIISETKKEAKGMH